MKFYQALGLALGFATAGCVGIEKKTVSEAPKPTPISEKTIENYVLDGCKTSVADLQISMFPTDIPGARTIQKYATVNSKYLLVHIRQTHAPKGDPEPDFEAPSDKKLNEDVYLILSSLMDRTSLRAVYQEGVVGNGERDAAYLIEFARQNGVTETIEMYDGNPWHVSVLFKTGAVRLALDRGGLDIRSAETGATKNQISIARSKGEDVSNLVMNGREGDLLKIITEFHSEETIHYTVFGGAHDWTDNIKKWNELFPDKIFSLIVITPKSYIYN